MTRKRNDVLPNEFYVSRIVVFRRSDHERKVIGSEYYPSEVRSLAWPFAKCLKGEVNVTFSLVNKRDQVLEIHHVVGQSSDGVTKSFLSHNRKCGYEVDHLIAITSPRPGRVLQREYEMSSLCDAWLDLDKKGSTLTYSLLGGGLITCEIRDKAISVVLSEEMMGVSSIYLF